MPSNIQTTNQLRQLRTILFPVSVLVLSAWGGANAEAEDSGPGQVAAVAQPLMVTDPNGAYFAEVTANGTGCPAGTWDTSISDDGKTFTTTFSAYETSLEPQKTIAVKDCQLGVTLHSPQGLSWTVESFYYQGYAYLEDGMVGKQTANYYFMGDPLSHAEARTDLRGPFDNTYLFQDDLDIVDLVWSPCGVERNLNVATRLRVQNNRQRTGTGYMNLLSVDASSELVFRLGWRSCT